MDKVQNQPIRHDGEIQRDTMNHDTSSSEGTPTETIAKFTRYKQRYMESTTSDNEIIEIPRKSLHPRSHYKSMGNINDNYSNELNRNLRSVQNSLSNLDVSLHSDEIKKFESLQIPIVGYEVMEERARFTIYKLKVEDDKRDQSWLVFRRYTDFVRLYSRIKAEQPHLMLPLPGKRWFRDNFEPAFLEDRVRGLQIFVNDILKKLPNHPIVRDFFCLDEPPTAFSYQPEVQAVYGALEDSITTLKMQLKQKDATIMHLQKRLALVESQMKSCATCSTNLNGN